MKRQFTTWILFLCISNLANEFGHAATLQRSAIRQSAVHNKLIDQVTAVDTLQYRTLQERQQDRHKRGIATIVLASSVAIGYASIGFETYLAIEGCCGLFPDACENKNEFQALQPILEEKGRKVDSDYLAAANTLEYVKQCTSLNHEIWISLKIIGDLSEELITTLNPDLTTQFQTKWKEIEEEVTAMNQTVIEMTYEQLDTMYHTLYDSTFGRMQLVGKLLGWPMVATAKYAYKQYQINEIQKTLSRTDVGRRLTNAKPKAKKFFGITDSSVQTHLRRTATSHYEVQMASSNMAFYFNVASTVYSLFSTGLDIYKAIHKVTECKNIRDKTSESLAIARQADKQLDDLQTNVTNYRAYVDEEGWTYVKEPITGDQFTEILEGLARLAENSSETAQTQDLANAATTMNQFISTVPSADYPTTFDLQQQLIPALDVMIFTINCKSKQVKLLQYVASNCKRGLDTLHALYTAGLKQYETANSQECLDKAGVPYISEAVALEFVQYRAAEEGFQTDCLLNNDNIKSLACSFHDLHYTDEEIAAKMGLTEEQVAFFTRDCLPPNSLSPQQINIVCHLRQLGMSDAVIASIIGLPQHEQQVAAVSCPTEPPPTALPQADQKKVCDFRGFGVPDTDIAKIMSYDLALVRIVICPID